MNSLKDDKTMFRTSREIKINAHPNENIVAFVKDKSKVYTAFIHIHHYSI
jgi:hypothetical protein